MQQEWRKSSLLSSHQMKMTNITIIKERVWLSLPTCLQNGLHSIQVPTSPSLQKVIQEYIINEREINDGNNGLDFYMRNGWITTEIHLACVLRYFTGGSYLDIMLLHGIGKTYLYHSIWAVVHATNACTTLQFSFLTTSAELTEICPS